MSERTIERGCGFREFYAYYLAEHAKASTRVTHVAGTLVFVASVGVAIAMGWVWLLAGVVGAYAFAWTGHLVFEKHRPATFRFPLYSLVADFRMAGEILIGRRGLRE